MKQNKTSAFTLLTIMVSVTIFFLWLANIFPSAAALFVISSKILGYCSIIYYLPNDKRNLSKYNFTLLLKALVGCAIVYLILGPTSFLVALLLLLIAKFVFVKKKFIIEFSKISISLREVKYAFVSIAIGLVVSLISATPKYLVSVKADIPVYTFPQIILGFFQYFLFAFFVSALIEETFFRSVIWGLGREHFSLIKTWILSSFLFWFYHFVFGYAGFELFLILPAFSLLLGLLTIKSKSVLAPSILHATYNAMAYLSLPLLLLFDNW